MHFNPFFPLQNIGRDGHANGSRELVGKVEEELIQAYSLFLDSDGLSNRAGPVGIHADHIQGGPWGIFIDVQAELVIELVQPRHRFRV